MEYQRHQRQESRFLQEVIEGPPCELCTGESCKDCIGVICEYCNLTGHTIKHCHLISFHNLHGICTYCRIKGHRRLQCPIAPQVPMPAQNNSLHVHGRTVQLQEKQEKVSDFLAHLEQDNHIAFVGFTELIDLQQHGAVGPQGNLYLKEEVQPQEHSHVAFVGFTEILDLEQHGAVGPEILNFEQHGAVGPEILNLEQHGAVGPQKHIRFKKKVQLQERSSSFVGFTELVDLEQHGAIGPQENFCLKEDVPLSCSTKRWHSECQEGLCCISMPYEDKTQEDLELAEKRYDVEDWQVLEQSFDIASLFNDSTEIKGLQNHSFMDTLAKDSQASGDVPGNSNLMAAISYPLASVLQEPENYEVEHHEVQELPQVLPFLYVNDSGVLECLNLAGPAKHQHITLRRPTARGLQALEVSSGIEILFDESVQEGDIMLPEARASSIPSVGQILQTNTVSFIKNALQHTASIHDFLVFSSRFFPDTNAHINAMFVYELLPTSKAKTFHDNAAMSLPLSLYAQRPANDSRGDIGSFLIQMLQNYSQALPLHLLQGTISFSLLADHSSIPMAGIG